jgi:hypothetical protein
VRANPIVDIDMRWCWASLMEERSLRHKGKHKPISSRGSATNWRLHEFADEIECGLRGSLVKIREAGAIGPDGDGPHQHQDVIVPNAVRDRRDLPVRWINEGDSLKVQRFHIGDALVDVSFWIVPLGTAAPSTRSRTASNSTNAPTTD